MEKVGKGRTVPVGAQVRVFWPLDDAWYGGEVVGHNEGSRSTSKATQGDQAPHRAYHDGSGGPKLRQGKVQLVSATPATESAGGRPAAASGPDRGRAQPGWILPNARRGAERVAVCGEGGVVVREMSLLDFHDEYVVSAKLAKPKPKPKPNPGTQTKNPPETWDRSDGGERCRSTRRGAASASDAGAGAPRL